MVLRTASPRLARIQEPVRERLDEVEQELGQLVVGDFDLIEEVSEYLVLLRGKLLRPTLLLLSNEVGHRPSRQATLLAAVVEAVHLATLVHDDAVDHSVLRRGMPTVNSIWGHQVAIIMGDYLYSRSVLEMARLERVDLIHVLARAANTMTVGEMHQLSLYEGLDFTEEEYYRLIGAKTASLMSAACELGAMVGDVAYREPLRRYGYSLGMAFQIADDILDYVEEEEVTGKPSGHDLREHKVTLPLIAALPNFTGEERLLVNDLFGDPEPGDEKILPVIRAVEKANGIEYARSRARHFAERAREAIEGIEVGSVRDALFEAVDYVIDRRQ